MVPKSGIVRMTVWWCLILSHLLSMSEAKMALYVFGDSLYDGGMTLYWGSKSGGAHDWPYGETYFKKPAGRYSDGRLIPDFIAEYAGLAFPKPYLLPGLNSYTNGINFASAGACALVDTRPNTLNLKMQMEYYRQMVQKMRQQLGETEANTVLSQAVYLFNIAGNDYVELVKKHINKSPLTSSYKKFYMKQIIGNLTVHIKSVYNEGGRKFAFQNIGPIGCMPSMKFMLGFKGTCVKEPQSLAKMHNRAFLKLMSKLENQLPGFKYSVYDFYTSLYSRVVDGNSYGFSETQTACCGSGSFNGDFTCQKKGEKFNVCSYPSNHLWFDAAHPTDKANQQFSKDFWTGSSAVVAPYNLKYLFSIN